MPILLSEKDKKWQLRNREALKLNRIEAVEAKIDKWEEVFQQALLNKNFASESYVLSKSRIYPT